VGGVLALLALGGPAVGDWREDLRFAAEMARRGNWREARFRWEQAARQQPDNPRLRNNLGVAAEALGDIEQARTQYQAALSRSRDENIEDNLRRFERFWRSRPAPGEPAPANDAAPEDPMPPGAAVGEPVKGDGKPMRVTVALPVPPQLDPGGARTLLVASFLTDDSALLDVNRELVRALRTEYRKHTELDVLEITPPPAVPEQTLEDLIANSGFWTHLGREYGADLVVSGVVTFERRDASGFQDVDIVSPTTGQKVRTSQFVEQEQFVLAFDVLFMDGRSGGLRHRDRLQRSAVFRGTQNDPLTAFYELSESVAPDMLAIVNGRTRDESRVVFKR
jgi:hypothetical protein